MRLANEIAAGAMEHVQGLIRPGMRESEVGAMWNGWVHDHGTGYEGKVELAHGFSLVWSGEGIRTFTATGSRPIQEHEPTLFEIWVCADGYWCDHTKNLVPGELDARYAELEQQLLAVYERRASRSAARVRASPSSTGRVRAGLAEMGYPGQPSHPICHGVGARAHEPPYAHQAGGGTVEAGMVLAIEPGVYWPEGGGLRVEDNFLITESGAGAALPLPGRDRPAHDDRPRPGLDGRAEPARARAADARHRRPLRHDAPRRRADRRRRALAGGQARDRPRARRGRRRPDRGRLRARLGGGRARRSG